MSPEGVHEEEREAHGLLQHPQGLLQGKISRGAGAEVIQKAEVFTLGREQCISCQSCKAQRTTPRLIVLLVTEPF